MYKKVDDHHPFPFSFLHVSVSARTGLLQTSVREREMHISIENGSKLRKERKKERKK
jgi:hypothetical protein